MRFPRISSGVLLCLLAGSVFGAPWRFSNPRPHGNNVLEMLFRDGIVWQVGDRGRVYTSADLDRWMPHETGTKKSLRGIITFQGNVYISAEEGTLLSGPRARELTIQTLSTTDWLEGITASPSTLVTVGDNGAIYSSNNGTDWNRRGTFSTWLRSVAYGGEQFICVGEDGFIATSLDGQTWQERGSPTTAHLNKVAWLNDRFWIVGDRGTVLTNNFRTSFVAVNVGVTNTLFTVTASSNEVVIAGDSIVLLGTPDGGTWSRQSDATSPLLAPNWPYYSSLWDGRLFLLSGQTGMLVEGFRTNSLAPLNWYSTIQPTRSWLWSVTRSTDFYAAVGANGTIVTSDDGVEWAREAVPAESAAEVLLGVGGNTNVLIAVGSRGTILRSENGFTNVVSTNLPGPPVTNQVSTFGLHWRRMTSPFSGDLQGVAATRDLLVITGGNGTILTSTDGIVWQPRTSGVTSFLSGATAWPQGFVVVGTAGVILTSPDGIFWTRRNSGVQSWIYSVRYVGEKLVAVGENGVILTSTDGVQWQARSSGTTEWLNDVTFAQGTWYITAGDGTLVTSDDAVTWTATKSTTSKSLYGAATSGDQVIAVGLEGVIMRRNLRVESTPVNIASYDKTALSGLFLFVGKIDQQFVLEESTSITGPWYPAAFLELSDPGGTAIYERMNDDAQMKFYRTRLL